MIKLENLEFKHIPLLKEKLAAYPRQACDYAICNLLTWGKLYNNQIGIYKDRLLILNPQYESLCFPIGAYFSPSELLEIIQWFRRIYKKTELILIPEEYLAETPDFGKLFEVSESEAWAEYIYRIETLVKLPGKKLHKKKNLVSQFVRSYPDYKVLQITADNKDVILSFTAKWKREREIDGIYLNAELKALGYAMEYWDELPIEGILICHHNKIAAFSIFSEQTRDTVSVHFEKFDPDKKGAAQIINWETARHLQDKYTWVNREQDLGLEGLRQAKKTYIPEYMLKFLSAVPL
ncbi:MAG: phosphatidylglycerol lysyltransferase domain-containing protein [Candidatus Cloacimonetes bacterium]|nr:phosphatidylglycerol lysyltransferase domain-containing protein [Candidatus Cloacimonadota bacterium]